MWKCFKFGQKYDKDLRLGAYGLSKKSWNLQMKCGQCTPLIRHFISPCILHVHSKCGTNFQKREHFASEIFRKTLKHPSHIITQHVYPLKG